MEKEMYIDDAGLEIIRLDTDLAEGSLKGCRQKFAKANQKETIERLIREIEDGSLYLGDWTKGEIQITGICRIISNRFWTEVEYHVLFPPRPGQNEPAKGTYRNLVWNVGIDAGAAALCLTEAGEIVLLRCFKHSERAWIMELPRGVRKPGESLRDCAIREAQEECGVVLTDASEVHDLGVYTPDNGAIRQRPRLACVTNVRVDETKVSRDVSESTLTPVVISLERLRALVLSGEVTCGWASAAYGRAVMLGLI